VGENWRAMLRLSIKSGLATLLAIWIGGCSAIDSWAASKPSMPTPFTSQPQSTSLSQTGTLSEVGVPASIAKLAPKLDDLRPQVKILSPQPNEILVENRAVVRLQVNDLPIFKHPELGLGNHLHAILDRDSSRSIYDLSQPLIFDNLAPGTHTIRVFATRPWHESFKNTGAFDLVTFSVSAPNGANTPNPQLPLLTYNRPVDTYGTEPVLLDFYLSNISPNTDWKVKATIADQTFILDRWEPIYLKGLQAGANFIKLELIDSAGNPIPNFDRDPVATINYDTRSLSPLDRLVSNQIDSKLAKSIVDPTLIVVKPQPTPAPIPTPVYQPPVAPTSAPVYQPPATPEPIPAPVYQPPVAPTPAPVYQPPVAQTPAPVYQPPAIPEPTPAPVYQPPATPAPTRTPVYQPPATPEPIPAPVYQPPVAPTPAPVYQPPATPEPIPTPVYQPPVAPTPAPVYQPPATPEPIPTPVYQPPVAPTPAPVYQPPATPEPIPTPIYQPPVALTPTPVYQPPATPEPTPTPIYQPPVAPTPAPVYQPPATSEPIPAPVYQPPVAPTPAPVYQPSATPAPIPTPVYQPPVAPTPAPVSQSPQIQNPEPQYQPTSTTTIQSSNPQSSTPNPQHPIFSFLNDRRSDIKKFTNTIPPNAQKFGRQMQIWATQLEEWVETTIARFQSNQTTLDTNV
jgi:hypothetical protein